MFLLFRRWLTVSHRAPIKILNAALISLVLNVFFGVAFYLAESPHQEGLSLADSIWWAMVTMTTVGYGDYFPVTWVGRFLIAYPCFMIGIGFIGFLFGVVVDSVLQQLTKNKKGFATMHLHNHFIIANSPSIKKILQIVEELRASPGNRKVGVVVIDPNLDEIPHEFKDQDIHFVKGEATSDEVLSRAALPHATGVLVLAQDASKETADAETFATGAVIKIKINESSSSPQPRLILELTYKKNRSLLEKVKADGIVAADGISEHMLVQELCNPGLSRIYDQLVSYKMGAELYLIPTQLSDKNLRDIQIKAIQHDDNIQILGLIREGDIFLNPKTDMKIQRGDQLIVLSDDIEIYSHVEQSLLSNHQ